MTLDGAEIYEIDGLAVTVKLNALQRAEAIAMSGTPGGMAYRWFYAQQGALRDVAGNVNGDQHGLHVLEHADVVPPVVLNAIMNYSTGKLIVNNTDIIDCTPRSRVAVEKFRIKNSTNSSTS